MSVDDEPRSPLAVLACPSCGAPLAIGDGDTFSCPHCQLTRPLPATYLALRGAERHLAGSRNEALRLYEELGRPPPRLRRLLVDAPALLASGIGVAVLAPLAILVVDRAAALLARLGVALSAATELVVALGFAFLLAGGALVAGAGARRRTAALRSLQAALSARPPQLPGRSASCRLCAAPLSASADALGARCLYCRGDNLLALEAWVAPARAAAAAVDGAIEQAASAHREELARSRASVRHQLAVLGAVATVFFTLLLFAMSI